MISIGLLVEWRLLFNFALYVPRFVRGAALPVGCRLSRMTRGPHRVAPASTCTLKSHLPQAFRYLLVTY